MLAESGGASSQRTQYIGKIIFWDGGEGKADQGQARWLSRGQRGLVARIF